jgi:alpha-glucosidase
VASVLEDGARTRPVYLPGEEAWYDFYSDAIYQGGQTIIAEAPLERIPLFVRAGGIIPLGKVMRHFGAEPDDVRQAFVFPPPGEGRGSFGLVEDDGVTLGYQRGEFTEVALQVIADPSTLELRAKARGNFALPYSRVEFVLPRGETRVVKSRGEVWLDEQGRKHIAVAVD